MKSHLSLLATAFLGFAPAITPAAAAELKLSDRLTKIASHLEAGGETGVHFSVTDTKDDLMDLAGFIDKLLQKMPENELPKSFKTTDLFRHLGLDALQGRGSSCHKAGDHWHSRSFILTDGKHEGLLSILGKKAAKPISHDFAPAGADLVLETSIDLRDYGKLVRDIGKSLGGKAESEIEGVLKQELDEIGMTVAGLFADFTMRGTIVLWLDDEKTFEIQRGVNLPVPHFAAQLNNATLLWKLISKDENTLKNTKVVEVDGKTYISNKEGPEQTPFGEIDPVLVWDPSTKQITMGLTEADLETCLGKGPKITTSESYQNATKGFPAESNSLAYLSSDVFRLIEILTKEFAPMASPEAQPFIDELLPYLAKLGVGGGYAAAIAVQDEGILATGNFPFAVKGESAFGGVAGLAVVAGIATPMMIKIKDKANKANYLNDLRSLGLAIAAYKNEKNVDPTSLEQLIEANVIEVNLAMGLADAGLEFAAPAKKSTLSSVVAYLFVEDEAMILFADLSVRVMPSWELEELLEAQKD